MEKNWPLLPLLLTTSLAWQASSQSSMILEGPVTTTTPVPVICQERFFKCATDDQCIPSNWVCDADFHCPDRSDEDNCTNLVCSVYQFKCRERGWCIPLTWRCDGEYDCGGGHIELTEAQAEAAVEAGEAVTRRASDGAATVLRGDLSDEDAGMCADASVTCPSRGAFRCRTHARCIPNRWVCDGDRDCRDGSDEKRCSSRPPRRARRFRRKRQSRK